MAELPNGLIHEVLKQLQDRMSSFEKKMEEIKNELQALRVHRLAVQQDIQNLCAMFVRHDARLHRIERRLELTEVAA
jgi:chromosome segregation ATPase